MMEPTFKEVYDAPEITKSMLDDPHSKPLLSSLRAWRFQKLRQLRSCQDLVPMGRLQGGLEVLDRILNLREELQDGVVQK